MLLEPDIRRDRALVEELLAEDFLEFGSSGHVWTLQTTLELLGTEKYTQPAMEDFACRILSQDVALVTYRSVRKDAGSTTLVEALRSSIWVRRRGKWKMQFHQGTRT